MSIPSPSPGPQRIKSGTREATNDTLLPRPGTSRLRRRAGKFLGPRIAQRIFLGYVLPLSVLLAFGLVLPIFLWSYLGRAIYDYGERSVMADRAVTLRRAAIDSEAHARGFLRYHDKSFEEQFADARDVYRIRSRELADYADSRQEPALTQAVDTVSSSYRKWQREAVSHQFRDAQQSDHPGSTAAAIAHNTSVAFLPVRSALDHLVLTTNHYAAQEQPIARAADLLRRITSVVIPLVAVLLSLLIGRSIALGITYPLEVLIQATEQLGEGKSENPSTRRSILLSGDGSGDSPDADDEIGDLQRAFRQMARTIQQREAVLRAQNEAVGALNRRMESVLNATNDGILLIDRAGGFSVVSQRCADLFGIPAEQIQDHTWAQAGPLLLSRFRNKAVVRERFREVVEDPSSLIEETFDVDGPGSLRSLLVYSAPVRGFSLSAEGRETESDLLGRIFVFRDVTRETMVDRMKTEFVSTVSHELRTPLTAIKGYVDLMVGGQTGPLTEVQTEFLSLVQVSTRRLTTLINDMLDISRIESERIEMHLDSVDYLPLVQQSIRMLQQEADQRQITLSMEVSGVGTPNGPYPAVSGDGDRITQVLTNFLSNGIKYTPPGGSVTVQIEFEDNFVTTCVADTGIGISLEDQRRLFQKFFRADNSTTREAGGTGLGLAITKAILEKMHGSVWVESSLGKGSRFWFTLPMTDLPSPSSLLSPINDNVSESSLSKTTVAFPNVHRLLLSIDGDVSLLHRIGHELRRRGFVVSNASNPADALRRARDLRPDLMTMDLLSPDLDAASLLRQLRENKATAPYPIALLSPVTHGGRMELRDTLLLVPFSASDEEWRELLRRAQDLTDKKQEADVPAVSGHELLLVLGDDALFLKIRRLLEQGSHSPRVVLAHNGEEADHAMGSDAVPIAVIADLRLLSEPKTNGWLARFRRRHPDEDTPFLVTAEDEIFAGSVFPLIPFGSGPLPVEAIGDAIDRLLAQLPTRRIVSPPLEAGTKNT